MDTVDPRQRRDLARLGWLVGLTTAVWLPLELVRRGMLPTWVFFVGATVALAAGLVMLPAAVRVFWRNRPTSGDQRYWTLD